MTDTRSDDEDRQPVDEKEWAAAELEASGNEDVASIEEKVEEGGQQEQGDPFRVEEDIAGRVPVWYGVRSCSDQSRAIAEMTPYYDRWVADTIAKHPNNTAVAKGFRNARYWWENKTVNGKRKCKGGFNTLSVYVDFA